MNELKPITTQRKQNEAWRVEWQKAETKVKSGEWSLIMKQHYLDTVYRAIFI